MATLEDSPASPGEERNQKKDQPPLPWRTERIVERSRPRATRKRGRPERDYMVNSGPID